MKLAATMLAGLFLLGTEAFAAGLGRLIVHSSLGQPLDAEVAISASAEELPTLSARLAPADAFMSAGIDFSPLLTGLRVAIERKQSGQPLLRLTTTQPVNEPFVQLLLELDWSGGRIRREYTLLLDPPEMLAGARAPSIATPVAPPAAGEPSPLDAQATAAKAEAPAAAAGQIRVNRGDTLAKIARAHKPVAVTLDQMLVALFEANPHAFSGENMNRLRAGAILRLPSDEELAAVDPGRAHTVVVAQGADFSSWKKRLAAATAAMPVSAAGEEHSPLAAAGKIQPRFQEAPPPAKAPQDKLEVSRTEIGKGKEPSLAKLEEELIARDKALREASERIAQLEKNIESLQRLVEIKAQGAAQLQQQAEASKKAAGEAAPAVPAPEAKPPAPPASAADGKPQPALGATAPVEQEKVAAPPAETAKPEAGSPGQAAPVAKPAAPKPAPRVVEAAPPPEPSFVEENLPLVLGGGGIVALLLGWLGYARWRRKKAAAPTEEQPAASSARESAPAALAETPLPSLTGAPSEMAPTAESSRFSTLAAISDPVAEAEVLLAYGRDAQAEEILLNAMSGDPTRTAIHAKLLEIYAGRRDARRFTEIALALREACQAKGEDWQKALALAATLGLPAAALMPGAAAGAPAARPDDVAEAGAGEQGAAASPGLSEETVALSPVAAMQAATFGIGPQRDEAAAMTTVGSEESEARAPSIDFILAKEEQTGAAAASPPLDFVLDLAAEPAPPTSSEEKASMEPMALDIDLGFVLEPPASAEPSPAQTSAPSPAGSLDFGLTGIDLELEPPTRSVEALSGKPQSFGGGGMQKPADDLDLVSLDDTASAATDALAPTTGGSVFGAQGSAEDDDPEVQTKLELADAYEEMGDLDGARELLNEILNEGSARQREQAQARLARLAA